MKSVKLIRSKTGDTGTFGKLWLDGVTFHTGELPDYGNQPAISCIPAGKYLCKWTPSNRLKKDTFQVMDVPGRTGIRFHSANWMGDAAKGLKAEVNGCIALGLSAGLIEGQEGIIGSHAAVSSFENLMGTDDFELEIVDDYQETGEPAAPGVA